MAGVTFGTSPAQGVGPLQTFSFKHGSVLCAKTVACVGSGANSSLQRHRAIFRVYIEAGRQKGTLVLNLSISFLHLRTECVPRYVLLLWVNLDPDWRLNRLTSDVPHPHPPVATVRRNRSAFADIVAHSSPKGRNVISFVPSRKEMPQLAGKHSRTRRRRIPRCPPAVSTRPPRER